MMGHDVLYQVSFPAASDSRWVEFMTLLEESYTFKDTQFFARGVSDGVRLADRKEYIESISEIDVEMFRLTRSVNGKCFLDIERDRSGSDVPLDKLTIYKNDSVSGPSLSDLALANVIRSVKKAFLTSSDDVQSIHGQDTVFPKIVSAHQNMIAELERAAKDILVVNTKKLSELELHYEAKRESLEAAYKEKEDNLRSLYDGKFSALSQREREIDERDNTHARRAIRNELKEKIRDGYSGFELSASTRKTRYAVHLAVYMSVMALSIITVSSYVASNDLSDARYYVFALKTLGLSIAIGGLIAWYIRWLNEWFKRHADAEFRLRQLELDVDRASWVVETALEWKAEQNSPIPDHLLTSISRNLFRSDEEVGAEASDPLDHLASALLGNASRLQLDVAGNKLDFDRKGLKGMQNHSKES